MAASLITRISCKCPNILQIIASRTAFPVQTHVRHHARWLRPFLFALNGQLKYLKMKYGEDPAKPRSHQDNWDYNSEIYAFCQRFGEEFNSETVRTAFTHKSYVEKEEKNRREMGLLDQDAKLQLDDNTQLANAGYQFSSDYIAGFLRQALPKVPEQGHRAINQYLMSGEVLSYVASNLGLRDLILCADFPVPSDVMESTFMAIIGGLLEDQGMDRAGLFVRDFIITQLMDKDLCDIWHIDNPVSLLAKVLVDQQREEPEARLLREAGKNTFTPLYMVGMYSEKKLLGWAPGESITVAEDEAARVALRNLFDIPENRPPLPLGNTIRERMLHQSIVKETEQGERHQSQIAAS
nr:39S ribosomal protein L44, mitochondrial-like [Lytechinus pictus]